MSKNTGKITGALGVKEKKMGLRGPELLEKPSENEGLKTTRSYSRSCKSQNGTPEDRNNLVDHLRTLRWDGIYWDTPPRGGKRIDPKTKRQLIGLWGLDDALAFFESGGGILPSVDVLREVDDLEERFHADAPADIPLADLIERYLSWCRTYYVRSNGEPKQEVRELEWALEWLGPYLNQPARDFGPVALRVVRELMVKSDRFNRKSINRNVTRICRMFKWAVSFELISEGVLRGLKSVSPLLKGRSEAREPKPVKSVPIEVVERTLPILNPMVADMVRVQLLLGIRPGELCNMREQDIDRTCDPWRWELPEHKTSHHHKSRVVYIGKQAQSILAKYLGHGGPYVFSPKLADEQRRAELSANRKTPLSCGNARGRWQRKSNPKRKPGDQYVNNSYMYSIKRAIRKANAKLPSEEQILHWHPNQLRHTRATQIRSRFDLETTRAVLGHSEAETTLIYAERDENLAREVAKAIG